MCSLVRDPGSPLLSFLPAHQNLPGNKKGADETGGWEAKQSQGVPGLKQRALGADKRAPQGKAHRDQSRSDWGGGAAPQPPPCAGSARPTFDGCPVLQMPISCSMYTMYGPEMGVKETGDVGRGQGMGPASQPRGGRCQHSEAAVP